MADRALRETEETLDSISNLLYQAQKPAEGLAAKFGKLTKDSTQLEVVMRFLSGSAAWRFLNKLKAVGLMINNWNKNLEEHNKSLRDAAKIYADEVKNRQGLVKLQESLLTIEGRRKALQSEMGVGLTELYGEEYAIMKLREMANEGLEQQENKMKAIASIQLDNKDMLAALGETKTVTMLRSGEKKEKNVLGKGETRDTLEAEATKRGLGKMSGGKFEEFSGFKKMFTKRWAKFKGFFTLAGSFIKKIGRMAWQYIKDGAKLIGMGLVYIGLIIIGIMLLKPFFVRMVDAWKVLKEKGGVLMEAWNTFKENLAERWGKMSGAFMNFWNLLWSKEATFSETLWAFLKFLWTGIVLVAGTAWDIMVVLLALAWEVSLSILAGIGKWVADTATWVWQKAKDWFYEKFIDGKSWWQTALAIILTVLGAYVGAIIASNMISSINPAVVAAGTFAGMAAGATLGYMGASLIGGMASGGIVGRGGKYLVGERGPEIVSLPRGAKVTPNHQIRNTGGNTVHVHVSGRVGASDQEIRDIARKVGAQVSREINRTTSSGVRL